MTDSNQTIPFTKMQGAGNDFVVLDNRDLQFSEDEIAALAPDICNRKLGVGSDGILALAAPQKETVDYTMIYRNPDGSHAGMCGNGARCIALFAHSLGFDASHTFNVNDQVYLAEVKNSKSVSVSFPMQAKVEEKSVDGQKLYQTHTGTEHIVLAVDEEKLALEDQLKDEGGVLRHHKQFQPKGTNVNFICGIEPTKLKLQTYERGVEDLTLACGTGAIASALVWHHLQQQNSPSPFYVETKGGTLKVHFTFNANTNNYSNIKLEGPAHFVFQGKYLR